ncbi:MAG TPA: hypothetical protein VGL08_01425 [Paraburkholderia sp.]
MTLKTRLARDADAGIVTLRVRVVRCFADARNGHYAAVMGDIASIGAGYDCGQLKFVAKSISDRLWIAARRAGEKIATR